MANWTVAVLYLVFPVFVVDSSNFIQPPELLELGKLLETHRPPQRLLLTLKSNPLDRDMELRDTALGTLSHLCDLITDHWNSRDTMADHISVM